MQATLKGRYTIERELDGGGMSQVFVAEEHRRERPAVDSALARAFTLRDRLGPWDRANIEGSYYGNGPGRARVKTIAAYEQVQNFGNNLSLALSTRRDYARTESVLRAVTMRDTSFALGQANLVTALLNQGRTDEASAAVGVLRRRFPSGAWAGSCAAVSYQRQDLDSTAFWLRRWPAGASGGQRGPAASRPCRPTGGSSSWRCRAAASANGPRSHAPHRPRTRPSADGPIR